MDNSHFKVSGVEVCKKWDIDPEKMYDIHKKFGEMIDDLPMEVVVALLANIIRTTALSSEYKTAKFLIDSISLNLSAILEESFKKNGVKK